MRWFMAGSPRAKARQCIMSKCMGKLPMPIFHRSATEEREPSTAEKRALLEMDRERSMAVKLQKELDAARKEAARAAAQHRLVASALQNNWATVRQQAGMMEGQSYR
jgi:hypothetical protein